MCDRLSRGKLRDMGLLDYCLTMLWVSICKFKVEEENNGGKKIGGFNVWRWQQWRNEGCRRMVEDKQKKKLIRWKL